MKPLILLLLIAVFSCMAPLFADDAGVMGPFVRLNGGWNFWPIGASISGGTGGVSFGGGLYYGNYMGIGLGIDAEYLPYGKPSAESSLFFSQVNFTADGSASLIPLCLTIWFGNPSGWYNEVGLGVGFNSLSGTFSASAAGNNYNIGTNSLPAPCFVVKYGTGYTFFFTPNFGLGIGATDYVPIGGIFYQLTHNFWAGAILDDQLDIHVDLTWKY